MFVSEKPKFSSRVRGAFSPPIPAEIRNKSGDWSNWFGQWEGQKKDWFDTNSCWAYAGNEVLEDQLEFLLANGYFNKADAQWFQYNGYIDEDGDVYLSRRFIPTLSGVANQGNDEAEFWRLTKKYGAIPNKMLPFTNTNEYFELTKITQDMYSMGKQFLTKVDIAYKELGRRFKRKDIEMFKAALFQTELQIGIPVPSYTMWNSGRVKWDGQTEAAHSVALYKIDEKADYEYPYFIYDQYEPRLKQLSRDYYIPICTQARVSPVNPAIANPVSQTTLGAKIWLAIYEFFMS